MSAKKFIVLPEWVTALKDRQNYLEERMDIVHKDLEKLIEVFTRIQNMEEDVKSLKQIVHEKQSDPLIAGYLKERVAQGQPAPNVPIINQLAGAKRTKATGHQRKSIHDLTLSYESKITPIEKDPNII